MTHLYLSREYRAIGADRELRRKAASGTLLRVIPGVFVAASDFAKLTADERYRLRVRAESSLRPTEQFSHESAAALWRLPSLDRWPATAHCLGPAASGGRSRTGLVRHGLGLDPTPAVIEGVTVTSLARTVVDIASAPGFARAVAMADSALRPPEANDFRSKLAGGLVSLEALRAAMDARDSTHGLARAQRVIAFANPLSGSPAESLSRVQIHGLGFPPPLLQVPFYDADGYIGTVDFYWPDFDLIGECDGDSKYGKDRKYGRDLTPHELLLREKKREDRLRRRVRAFTRWGWREARDRRLLAARLRELGIR